MEACGERKLQQLCDTWAANRSNILGVFDEWGKGYVEGQQSADPTMGHIPPVVRIKIIVLLFLVCPMGIEHG